MKIGTCRDKDLLNRMNHAVQCQLKRVIDGEEEKTDAELAEITSLALKVQIRLVELG